MKTQYIEGNRQQKGIMCGTMLMHILEHYTFWLFGRGEAQLIFVFMNLSPYLLRNASSPGDVIIFIHLNKYIAEHNKG